MLFRVFYFLQQNDEAYTAQCAHVVAAIALAIC
jgi:hypothetical protein